MVLNRPGNGSSCSIVTESSRLNDRQLVTRCLGGDPAAERALYDMHVERIYRLMHRMAGDADLAADFTQDTFIRAFERLEQYRAESSLATWLHTIAVSVALNGMRKVKRLRGRVESVDGIEGSPNLVVAPTGFTGDLKARLHAAEVRQRRQQADGAVTAHAEVADVVEEEDARGARRVARLAQQGADDRVGAARLVDHGGAEGVVP